MGTAAANTVLKRRQSTGAISVLEKTTVAADGGPMSDVKINALYPKIDGEYYKEITYELDVRKHCAAANDGTTDATAAINKAIDDAVKNRTAVVPVGYKQCINIRIPAGKYRITSALIFPAVGDRNYSFRFIGDGMYNTTIAYEPATESFLFDNNDFMGFSVFENLCFDCTFAESKGKFMRMTSALSAPSSITFNNVFFSKWKQIIHSVGTVMGSEITFNDCKIWGGPVSGQILFYLDNPMSTNWRLKDTDMQNIPGTIFHMKQGAGIYVSGGSIISDSGKVVVYDAASSGDFYYSDTAPHIVFQNVRYELRDATALLEVLSVQAKPHIHWLNCQMGAYNRTSGVPLMKLKGFGNLLFTNCYEIGTWQVEHEMLGSEYVNPDGACIITFIGGVPPTLSNVVTNAVCGGLEPFAWACLPTYSWVNCKGFSWTGKPLKEPSQVYHRGAICGIQRAIPVRTLSGTDTALKEVAGLVIDTSSADWVIDTSPMGLEGFAYDVKLCLLPVWSGGYEGFTFTINAYSDLSKIKLIGTGSFTSDAGIVLNLSEGKPFKSDQVVITLTPTVMSPYYTAYRFLWHILYI